MGGMGSLNPREGHWRECAASPRPSPSQSRMWYHIKAIFHHCPTWPGLLPRDLWSWEAKGPPKPLNPVNLRPVSLTPLGPLCQVLSALQAVVWGLGSCAQLLPLMAKLCHLLLVRLSEEDAGPAVLRPASDLDSGPGTSQGVPGR